MNPDKANYAVGCAGPAYPDDWFAHVTHRGVEWIATDDGWRQTAPGYRDPTVFVSQQEAQDQADHFLAALCGASRGFTMHITLNHRSTMGYTRNRWRHRCDRFNEIVNDDGLSDSEKMEALSTLVAGSGIEEFAGWSDDLKEAAWRLKNEEPTAVTDGNRLLQCVYDTADEEGIWLGL